MPNKMIKTYRKELKLTNCGFDNDPELMVRSQWQSRSKNNFYLLYRWLVAVFVTAVVIISMHSDIKMNRFGQFFIYLTHWGILLNMVVGVLGAVLVTIWHFHTNFQENVLENGEMPLAFKIYWALHNTALTLSFEITIIYWSILHNDKIPLDLSNVLSHAMNSVIMFLDILIVAYPLRLYHVIQPICFQAIYGIFSYVHYLLGNGYIYYVLDWSRLDIVLITMFGILTILIIVHMILFWIYKLRIFIHRRFFTTELTLPTQTSLEGQNKSLRSHISMEFGADNISAVQ